MIKNFGAQKNNVVYFVVYSCFVYYIRTLGEVKMQPIYCFKELPTGEITKREIPEYNVRELYNHKKVYYYIISNRRYDFKESDIDKLIRDRVYSYDPDIEHARKVILNSLLKKFQCYFMLAGNLRNRMDKIKQWTKE